MAQTKVKLVSNGVITVDNLHTNHGITTDHIGEGSVLYYTDARVQSYLTSNNYITTTDVASLETLTSLSLAANILTYTDEVGNTTNLDLSLYLDDTNLARLVSGTLDGATGIATFTRDDATTFTVDLSSLTPSETDPVFTASAASGITLTNISNWDTAYGWGNHASAGYLTSLPSHTHMWTDITDRPTALSSFTNDAGFITSFTESDPTVPSHVKSITTTKISNWDTAFGWGNHASAGYQSASTAITTGNIGSQSVSYANTSGDASSVQGRTAGTGTNNLAYLSSTRNLIINNPETYSGEVRLGAAWGYGGVYASNTLTMASSSSINFVINNAVYATLNTSYFTHNSDIRTPIFYDSNDTGYYGDFASTSRLNILNLAGYGYVGGQTTNGQSHYQWDGATYRNPNTHTPSLLIRADNVTTGINGFRPALSIHNNNGGNQTTVGLVFTSAEGATGAGNSVNLAGIIAKKESAGNVGAWSPGSLTFFVKDFSTRRDGMFIATSGYVQSDYSFRAPIFYDSNDTGYYVDPASTSNLNSLYIQGGVAGVSNSAVYHQAAVEIRERGFGGAQDDTWATAPRIGMHWGGRVASQIALSSNGWINILNNPGNNYEGFRAGAIYSTGDVTAYYSDVRLKDIQGPIENALASVLSIETFKYKNNEIAKSFGFTKDEVQVGVSAQSIEKVLPEVVKHAPFDIESKDGENVSKSGKNYLTVQYEKIVPLLIEAIKEQQQQIEELKSLINK